MLPVPLPYQLQAKQAISETLTWYRYGLGLAHGGHIEGE